MRVQKTQCKSLVRRNAFSQIVVIDWNALPNDVVQSIQGKTREMVGD